MRKRQLYLAILLLIYISSLFGCAKTLPEKVSINEEQLNETGEEQQYPNDEYIVIGNGNDIFVLNDDFVLMKEFIDLPRIKRNLFSSTL